MSNAVKLSRSTLTAFVVSALTVFAAVPNAALAVTDYSPITDAVDWSDVGTSIIAVGAAIAAIFVVIKGVKLVTRMVKGA